MSEAVLDASATLALMMGEAGAERVAAFLPGALMSTVNVAEVVAKLVERDPAAAAKVFRAIGELGIDMVPFDGDQALISGALRSVTCHAGLSLGDRACLAVAKVKNLPVVTADRAWLRIAEAALVQVVTIRD